MNHHQTEMRLRMYESRSQLQSQFFFMINCAVLIKSSKIELSQLQQQRTTDSLILWKPGYPQTMHYLWLKHHYLTFYTSALPPGSGVALIHKSNSSFHSRTSILTIWGVSNAIFSFAKYTPQLSTLPSWPLLTVPGWNFWLSVRSCDLCWPSDYSGWF